MGYSGVMRDRACGKSLIESLDFLGSSIPLWKSSYGPSCSCSHNFSLDLKCNMLVV